MGFVESPDPNFAKGLYSDYEECTNEPPEPREHCGEDILGLRSDELDLDVNQIPFQQEESNSAQLMKP